MPKELSTEDIGLLTAALAWQCIGSTRCAAIMRRAPVRYAGAGYGNARIREIDPAVGCVLVRRASCR